MSLIQIKKDPSKKELQTFGTLFLAFSILIGLIFWWRSGSLAVAQWIWAIGIGLMVIFFAVPLLRKPIYLGWIYLTFPIGWVITHLIMAITFYGVVTPIGLIMRAVGKDPMERGLNRAAASYWIPHQSADSAERYFRQF